MIIIVDYGMGNLRSVENAFLNLGIKAKISSQPAHILKAERLVFPGVSAFCDAMAQLKNLNLLEPIAEFIKSKKPFLGICLGQQLLFSESQEGNCAGFNIIQGVVKKFSSKNLKVPHMGWNKIEFPTPPSRFCPLFKDIGSGTFMYFAHSYYGEPKEKTMIAATTEYGVKFASAIWKDNIYAVQFHPEKSQAQGLKFLNNFARV